MFTLKWYEKQKSALPAARVIFRLHWRERKKKKKSKMHVILHFRLARRVGKGGDGKREAWGCKADKMERKGKR